MNVYCLRCISATVSVLCFSAAASAQIPTSGNIFFGYSYSQAQVFSSNSSANVNANGWHGSVEGKFLPWVGLVGELDWHYGSHALTECIGAGCVPALVQFNASRNDILFGPRVSISLKRYRPFAEFLLGVAHETDSGGGVSNSDTGFATGFGGGLDYKLIKGVAARIQFDSIHHSLFGHGSNDPRISTGIVFKF